MQTILCVQNGRRQLGLILDLTRDTIRVAFPGRTDVVELRSVDGQWLTDSGKSIEVEGILLGETASGTLDQTEKVRTAGGSSE